MSLRPLAVAAPALVLCLACRSRERATSTDTAAPAAAVTTPARPDTAAGTRAMGGMAGMHADTVAQRVQHDLAAMDAAPRDSIVRLVPEHRQTVAALIADCEMMMRQMKMTPPRKWTNAVAALRQDLGKMATADARTVHAMWPDHKQRVQTMLDMRHDMMSM